MVIDKLARPVYELELTDAKRESVDHLVRRLETNIRTGGADASKIAVRGLGRLIGTPKDKHYEELRLKFGRQMGLPYPHARVLEILLPCLEHSNRPLRQEAVF